MEGAGVKIDENKIPAMRGGANYFSGENLKVCVDRRIEAVILDSRAEKRLGTGGKNRCEADDFTYNETDNSYKRPQGRRLEYKKPVNSTAFKGRCTRQVLQTAGVALSFQNVHGVRRSRAGKSRVK
jgi:hypothetical protein